jgi:signal transduction histidine kinase
VLNNLIANAFKYSIASKAPIVTLRFLGNEFSISVRDYGIGIPENDRDNIFQSFFRASNTDEIEGTGLGLVISKNLVERHNGKIYFKFPFDGGTEFVIEFKEPFIKRQPFITKEMKKQTD